MWAQYLLGSKEALQDFNNWVDDRIVFYSVQAMEEAKNFASIKGVRYLIGELEAQRTIVNWIPTQAAVEAQYKENFDE